MINNVTHRFAEDQFDVLVNGIAGLIAELRIANGRAATAPRPAPVPGEPWTFHSPQEKRDVVAFVDDRNQVRHVPVDRADDVPATWRMILLAPSGVPTAGTSGEGIRS